MTGRSDPILNSIVRELKEKHHCHTVVLYGSRARGLTTSTSDYDVVGIRKKGKKYRIAKKQNGFFWDVFIYAEKDLRKFGDEHFAWKHARVIYQKHRYGTHLLRRLERHLKMPYKAKPHHEIKVTKIWAQKELERCRLNDVHGLYRRAEFRTALIVDYFFVRQKRFPGPKEAFAWLEKNDPNTFRSIHRALKSPNHLSYLKAAASRVYWFSV